jgi:hypothetical protein
MRRGPRYSGCRVVGDVTVRHASHERYEFSISHHTLTTRTGTRSGLGIEMRPPAVPPGGRPLMIVAVAAPSPWVRHGRHRTVRAPPPTLSDGARERRALRTSRCPVRGEEERGPGFAGQLPPDAGAVGPWSWPYPGPTCSLAWAARLRRTETRESCSRRPSTPVRRIRRRTQ